jgi:hypothetical protein
VTLVCNPIHPSYSVYIILTIIIKLQTKQIFTRLLFLFATFETLDLLLAFDQSFSSHGIINPTSCYFYCLVSNVLVYTSYDTTALSNNRLHLQLMLFTEIALAPTPPYLQCELHNELVNYLSCVILQGPTGTDLKPIFFQIVCHIFEDPCLTISVRFPITNSSATKKPKLKKSYYFKFFS